MAEKKKVTDLPLVQSLVGLYTIGVDAANNSVRVSLEWLKTAYDNVTAAISKADRATESANTAAGKADRAATDAGAVMVQLSEEVSQLQDELSASTALVIADTNRAKDNAITATGIAISVSDHPGYIGSDYHVYTWNYVTSTYNKTDTVLRPEGFSIFRQYTSVALMNADKANVPEGKFVLINTNDVEQADNAKLYVKGATDFNYLVDMSGAIGFTGKTPQITIGNVTVGSSASATLSPDGTDASGNPKFKLNLVIVAGPQGLMPVIEMGTVTTGEPDTNVLADLVLNGQTADGRDKYLLNVTIPRGTPGTGSGNVSASGTGLVTSKKYLFVPSANGTTTGTFVEYVAPTIPEQVQPDWNATAGKAAILNKPTIPSKTSQLSNDSNFATTTDIGNHNTSAVAHSDIRQALSDVEAIARGKSRAKVFDTVAALDVWLGVPANVATLQVGDNFYIKALDVPDYWWDGTAKQPIEAEKVDLTEYLKSVDAENTYAKKTFVQQAVDFVASILAVFTVMNVIDYLNYIKNNLNKFLNFFSVTTTTSLTGLPITNYSIQVTLSSASALSFINTPAPGWECMIDIKNTSSSTITQPLPNASGWQCEDASLTIAAGKIASISVRYIHNTYVIIAKGN